MAYFDDVKQDALEAIEDCVDYYDTYEEFIDSLWVNDSVTGNGSGSYYFNSYKAKKRVLEAFNEDDAIFAEYSTQFGTDALADSTNDGHIDWEGFDVRLRCAALGMIDIEDEWNIAKGGEQED